MSSRNTQTREESPSLGCRNTLRFNGLRRAEGVDAFTNDVLVKFEDRCVLKGEAAVKEGSRQCPDIVGFHGSQVSRGQAEASRDLFHGQSGGFPPMA